MIKIQNLSRLYGQFVAVDNVSFDINPGEIVGLLGHNGAGKSTVMKMLSGHLEPSAGTIEVEGLDIVDNRMEVQHKIGYLPENLPIYPEMAVIDYLQYVAQIRGLTNTELTEGLTQAIESTSLQEKLAVPINTLSRGYKQRVAVASAILNNPKVLILDEPTNGLDPTQTQHMRHLIRKLSKQATIILSTHIMQEVSAICDRVMIMSNGALALDKKLRQLEFTSTVSLVSSIPITKLKSLTKSRVAVQEVSQIKQTAKNKHYQIKYTPKTNLDEEGAILANLIVGEGYQLFQLGKETHDLETVFVQVSSQELKEENHVA